MSSGYQFMTIVLDIGSTETASAVRLTCKTILSDDTIRNDSMDTHLAKIYRWRCLRGPEIGEVWQSYAKLKSQRRSSRMRQGQPNRKRTWGDLAESFFWSWWRYFFAMIPMITDKSEITQTTMIELTLYTYTCTQLLLIAVKGCQITFITFPYML